MSPFEQMDDAQQMSSAPGCLDGLGRVGPVGPLGLKTFWNKGHGRDRGPHSLWQPQDQPPNPSKSNSLKVVYQCSPSFSLEKNGKKYVSIVSIPFWRISPDLERLGTLTQWTTERSEPLNAVNHWIGKFEATQRVWHCARSCAAERHLVETKRSLTKLRLSVTWTWRNFRVMQSAQSAQSAPTTLKDTRICGTNGIWVSIDLMGCLPYAKCIWVHFFGSVIPFCIEWRNSVIIQIIQDQFVEASIFPPNQHQRNKDLKDLKDP